MNGTTLPGTISATYSPAGSAPRSRRAAFRKSSSSFDAHLDLVRLAWMVENAALAKLRASTARAVSGQHAAVDRLSTETVTTHVLSPFEFIGAGPSKWVELKY